MANPGGRTVHGVSALAQLLGLRVRNQLRAWMFIFSVCYGVLRKVAKSYF
jgi:hypothetical protein